MIIHAYNIRILTFFELQDVFFRRNAGTFFEILDKIAGIIEADSVSSFGHRQVCACQEFLAFRNAVFQQILIGTCADHALEAAAAFSDADMNSVCDVF